MKTGSPILYPQVTRLPSESGVTDSGKNNLPGDIKKGEFDQALRERIGNNVLPTSAPVSPGVRFSAHATQRLKERNIHFEPEMMARMNDAISKADAKGVQESLVLTPTAALIVSVPNRTVITAMDREQMSGNVFTNIDGAIII